MDKQSDEVVSSYRFLLLARNASGFDSWVALNSLDWKNKRFEYFRKLLRGLISLSLRCGGEIVITVKVGQYVEFTCSESHIK